MTEGEVRSSQSPWMQSSLILNVVPPFFSPSSTTKMNILLLTEELGDRTLFVESATELSGEHTLLAAECLGEFWDKLTSQQIPLPNLIFLDAELSRSYDHELIEVFKSNPALKVVPIVVYASSVSLDEVSEAYGSQVACFVVLPLDPAERRTKIRTCLEFWTSHAELPELRRWWPRQPES